MDHDRDLGFQAQPVRYSTGERETIDRIRDAMTDEQFVAFCWGNVVRYASRAGTKGPVQVDHSKAEFYREMALHVTDGLAGLRTTQRCDPRHRRAGFKPYRRQPYPAGLYGVGPADAAPLGWYDAQLTHPTEPHEQGRAMLFVDVPEQAAARLGEGRTVRLRVRPGAGGE